MWEEGLEQPSHTKEGRSNSRAIASPRIAQKDNLLLCWEEDGAFQASKRRTQSSVSHQAISISNQTHLLCQRRQEWKGRHSEGWDIQIGALEEESWGDQSRLRFWLQADFGGIAKEGHWCRRTQQVQRVVPKVQKDQREHSSWQQRNPAPQPSPQGEGLTKEGNEEASSLQRRSDHKQGLHRPQRKRVGPSQAQKEEKEQQIQAWLLRRAPRRIPHNPPSKPQQEMIAHAYLF